MSAGLQEVLALGIVAIVFAKLGWDFFRSVGAQPLANYLLKRGKVKPAMRLRAWALRKKGGCGSCGPASGSGPQRGCH